MNYPMIVEIMEETLEELHLFEEQHAITLADEMSRLSGVPWKVVRNGQDFDVVKDIQAN